MCVELTRIVKTSSVTPSSILSPSWKNLSGVSCLDILRLLQVYIDLRSRHRGKGYRYHLHTPGFPFARWADLGCTTNYLVKWSFTHPYWHSFFRFLSCTIMCLLTYCQIHLIFHRLLLFTACLIKSSSSLLYTYWPTNNLII
jgi:hypothetical protein